MHIIWIKVFNSCWTHGPIGNASLWSVHAEMAFATLIYRCDRIEMSRDVHLHIESRSRVIRLSRENVARIGHFLPANNSFVLLSRTIVFVHVVIFCVFDRTNILFCF